MRLFAFSFIAGIALIESLSAHIIQLEENCSCGSSDPLIRASFRHIETKGIGYSKGYTTLSLFLEPFEPIREAWVPFFDLRGHLFNDGKFAANGGIGARYLSYRVWGINGYYDYRKAKFSSYNQLSLGLESLGKKWDLRLNGYLPIGKDHKRKRSKEEFAMSGIDAEFGIYLRRFCNGSFYLAAGPYYLHDTKKNGGGGKLRLTADFLNYLRLEGSASWDSIFKTRVQGEIGFIFAFGPTRDICKRRGFSCSQTLSQRNTAMRDVGRKEIIVIRDYQKSKPGPTPPPPPPPPTPPQRFEEPIPASIIINEVSSPAPVEESTSWISDVGSYIWSWVPKPWNWF